MKPANFALKVLFLFNQHFVFPALHIVIIVFKVDLVRFARMDIIWLTKNANPVLRNAQCAPIQPPTAQFAMEPRFFMEDNALTALPLFLFVLHVLLMALMSLVRAA